MGYVRRFVSGINRHYEGLTLESHTLDSETYMRLRPALAVLQAALTRIVSPT
jgi:hypothetical protein